jgi:hypothetical protein
MPDIFVALIAFGLIACGMFVKGFTRMFFCVIFIGFVLRYVIVPGIAAVFR